MNHKFSLKDQTNMALKDWREMEKKAHDLLQIVSALRFDRSIELVIFRKDIYDTRPSEVLNSHNLATNFVDVEISIEHTLSLAQTIAKIENLPPCKLDIGKLAAEWITSKNEFQNKDEFIHFKLKNIIGSARKTNESRDVVLYGFGRIGRLVARRIIGMTGKGEQLRLKAIVIRSKLPNQYEELQKRAALLQSDSVHGDFPGVVRVSEDGNELIINGNRVLIIFANKPEDVDYTEYGIQDALLIDNTGVWRDSEALSQHLRPGVEKVILTAPGKNMPNIVHGVNHKDIDFEKHKIISAASCTTNAIVPLIQMVDQEYGIDKGHIETIHAYTSDQNLLDNFHKKQRRGRGAAINMVLTTTGAAKAVAKVLPHLDGKLTGNAVRVPTPNVSLAIIMLSVQKPTNVSDMNNFLREKSLSSNLVEQIHYSTSTEYVSSNAVGMISTSVLDGPSTIVSSDGRNITLYAWYDNEFGYTCQVVRLAKYFAKVRRYSYY